MMTDAQVEAAGRYPDSVAGVPYGGEASLARAAFVAGAEWARRTSPSKSFHVAYTSQVNGWTEEGLVSDDGQIAIRSWRDGSEPIDV